MYYISIYIVLYFPWTIVVIYGPFVVALFFVMPQSCDVILLVDILLYFVIYFVTLLRHVIMCSSDVLTECNIESDVNDVKAEAVVARDYQIAIG